MSSKIRLITIAVAVILVLGLWLLYQIITTQSFELLDTTPENGETIEDFNPVLEFEFSEELANVAEYESSPTINAQMHIDQKTLSLVPEHELLEDTGYTVRIENIESVSGEIVEEATLLFSTGLDQSPRARFIRELPVYRDGYNITYVENSDRFIVQVTSEPIERHRNEAREFLTENNITEENETIEFEVMRSLEGGGSPPG